MNQSLFVFLLLHAIEFNFVINFGAPTVYVTRGTLFMAYLGTYIHNVSITVQ